MNTPFTHPDLGALHLGRSAPSPRTKKSMAKAFALHSFMVSLPTPPVEVDNTKGRTDWGMMKNDLEGCCTCSTCGHLIQTWTGITVPDAAVETEYEQACGYVPGNPATDHGGIITNVLDYFKNVGVGGYKIAGHAEVNLTQFRIQQAIYTFGAVDLGIELPVSAQNQVGVSWDFINDAPDAPGTWGGHSVAIMKYDATGVWCVTWGKLQFMTWRWFMYYVDEGHACASPDFQDGPISYSQLPGELTLVTS